MENLLGVRSLDKAFEVQSEYARTAYEGYVSHASRLGQLYTFGKRSLPAIRKLTAITQAKKSQGQLLRCPLLTDFLSDSWVRRIAGCHTPTVLDLIEEPLDQVSSAIEMRTERCAVCPLTSSVAAGHRLDVVANYPFERSHRFAGIQPNSGHRDYSRFELRR
jgi:Phasin protein